MKLYLSKEEIKTVVQRLEEYDSRMREQMKSKDSYVVEICEEALATNTKISAYLKSLLPGEYE